MFSRRLKEQLTFGEKVVGQNRHMKTSTFSDEAVETTIAVLEAGWASRSEIADAVAARRALRPPIGELLLKRRKLTMRQVFQILEEQATSGKLFGRIAIEMGFATETDINEILQLQNSLSPSLLQMLLSREILTPEQAKSVEARIHARLRQHADTALSSC